MSADSQPRKGAALSQPDVDLLRLLVESVLDYAIFALDSNGYVLTWNAGAQRLKGYSAAEIIGQHFSIFYPEQAIASSFPQRELEEAAKVGRFEDEGWRLRKGGTRFWANVVVTALRDHTGRLIGYAKVTRDLTARREAEEQARRLAAEEAAHAEAERRREEIALVNDRLQRQALQLEAQSEEARSLAEELEQTNNELAIALHDAEQARAVAERAAAAEAQANRSKSQFLTMMSHELRTPLNAIAGYAELLELGVHGALTEAQREAVSRIQRSERHLLSLINDVLNFAKLEAGHVSVILVAVPVADLLSGLDGLVAPQIRARQLQYSNLGAPPGLLAVADQEKAAQVLLNLLSNAIKFTDAGGGGASRWERKLAVTESRSGFATMASVFPRTGSRRYSSRSYKSRAS